MSRRRKERNIARSKARMKDVTFVETPLEPGQFFVLFLDDGISPGRMVTGTDFREDLPREIERAEEEQEDESYVEALRRGYTWFDRQEKRRQAN